MSDSRYCGVIRNLCESVENHTNISFADDTALEPGKLVGDRILEAVRYGTDVGVSVSVSFDEDVKDDADSHEVDLMASPNHDFFDIAERTGRMVEVYAHPNEEKED